MKVVIDIEANSLVNPSSIWVIVCKDIDTGLLHIFREVTSNVGEKERFLTFADQVERWIGHNWMGYDYPVLHNLLGLDVSSIADKSCDTLILSKLIDYPRKGHSIENYGLEFGIEKIKFNDFKKYSTEMEEYCIRDVEICHKVYLKYLKYILKEEHKASILIEHKFQLVVNTLSTNGFSFNVLKATKLLSNVVSQLEELDNKILTVFVPKEVLIKEFIPKLTKFNTISKTSVPRVLHDKIHEYTAGNTYRHTRLEPFNPSSHKQVIDVLSSAGWRPIDKTQTYIDTERELSRLKHSRQRDTEVDLKISELYTKLTQLEKTGYKINENNLATLPDSAPTPARLLAKRILLESRRRTLTEWLGLVQDDGRIHGKYYGIGAWTHRMAHQQPNTANIPNEFDTNGAPKLLGKEMRSLWQAPRNRLLVGVDAEGIQLRIFAHYIDDKEFTQALIEGKKDDKTDPHSLNQRILGDVCKSRSAAKRFIYALLLGAGLWKLAQILGCSEQEAREALDRLLRRYTGWALLKEEAIPSDARKGYFIGLDGRRVRIPGETISERKHLCMSGYLQNGEAVVMKYATVKWVDKLKEDNSILVNFVHDEWQTETPNNMEIALKIAKVQADSLREVGEELGLKCPLAGSYYNDDHKDYTIGTNWYQTH